MARSVSRSSCRRIPPSVYCKGSCKKRSRRSRKSRRRRSRSRRRRSQRRSGRRRSSRRSGKRRCWPGKKTKNPFLNYLRVFRSRYCGWPQTKIAVEGAKCWCKMSDKQRSKFYKQACSMLRKKGKRRGRSRSKRRSRRSKKRSKKRKGKRSCPT